MIFSFFPSFIFFIFNITNFPIVSTLLEIYFQHYIIIHHPIFPVSSATKFSIWRTNVHIGHVFTLRGGDRSSVFLHFPSSSLFP